MRRWLTLGPLVLAMSALIGGGSAGATVGPVVPVSGQSPFPPACNGAPQAGTLYPNTEVEPYVAADPLVPRRLVAVWQQDRWSDGGAQGNLTAYSRDRGRTWQRPVPPPFSRCAGGSAANGGDYERASDPWVSIGPDGTAHQIALAISDSLGVSAILVSSSRNGGRTWGPITTLQRDTTAELFNDKESITADPTDSDYVYAVWDRLQVQTPEDPASPFSGDTLFARSTDGGRTWEPTRTILDFPDDSRLQSLGNQIVVLGDGTLVNVFTLIDEGVPLAAVQRSEDKGETWSDPILIDVMLGSEVFGQGGVIDPSDGAPVRTGGGLPDAAADPRDGSSTLYVAWQDLRFTLLGTLAIDQIVVSSSTDGGLNWSDPRRASSSRDVQSFTGSVEVARDGTVAVSYYDFTFDDPTGGPLDTDRWFTASRDGGLTFSPRERLTPESFDRRTAPNARGFFVGDYVGLAAVNRRFSSVHAVASSGSEAIDSDVVSTLVRPSFGESLSATALTPRRALEVEAPLRGPATRR